MYFINFVRPLLHHRIAYGGILLFSLLFLVACKGDNLNPDGEDKRVIPDSTSQGWEVSQTSPDQSLLDTEGERVSLENYREGGDDPVLALVIYFTMWCPVCATHSDHIQYDIMPRYAEGKNVRYLLIDYVNGSPEATKRAAKENGYEGVGFQVLLDKDQVLLNEANAGMGTVIVLDSSGMVKMNEFFNDGSHLIEVLDSLNL